MEAAGGEAVGRLAADRLAVGRLELEPAALLAYLDSSISKVGLILLCSLWPHSSTSANFWAFGLHESDTSIFLPL